MNTTFLFNELASALKERLKVIGDHELRDRDPALHLKKLQEASEAIEQCVASLPRTELHPQLRHYLERRSYDKALAYLLEESQS